MRFRDIIVLLFVSTNIISCAAMQPKFQDVNVPPEKISLMGFSFLPLNEKGWKILGRNQYQIALAKYGENQDETFAIQTIPTKLPTYKTEDDLALIVKEGQIKDTDLKRFKIVNHDVKVYKEKGTDCVISHLETEDHAAAKKSWKIGYMILEVETLTCAHPKDKGIGVNLIYSHRYYPENKNEKFSEKAISVLNSIEFLDF